MPDIREILAALTPEDKVLWSQHRTEMRRSYMCAHNSILGTAAWDAYDDSFVDLIDIKLAIIFERAGAFKANKQILEDDGHIERVEADIHDAMKEFKPEIKLATLATASMQNGNIQGQPAGPNQPAWPNGATK